MTRLPFGSSRSPRTDEALDFPHSRPAASKKDRRRFTNPFPHSRREWGRSTVSFRSPMTKVTVDPEPSYTSASKCLRRASAFFQSRPPFRRRICSTVLSCFPMVSYDGATRNVVSTCDTTGRCSLTRNCCCPGRLLGLKHPPCNSRLRSASWSGSRIPKTLESTPPWRLSESGRNAWHETISPRRRPVYWRIGLGGSSQPSANSVGATGTCRSRTDTPRSAGDCADISSTSA